LKKILLLFIILKSTHLISQTDLQVVNSSALSLSNNDYCFDISIGEVINSSISDSFSICTQGFLQTDIIVTNFIDYNNNFSKTLIYPNPFFDVIKIDSKVTFSSIIISDNTGRKVYESLKCIELNLGFLNSGIYTITLINSLGNAISKHNICKFN
jgi:hypothetical protein